MCAKRGGECTQLGTCLSRGSHRAFSGPPQDTGKECALFLFPYSKRGHWENVWHMKKVLAFLAAIPLVSMATTTWFVDANNVQYESLDYIKSSGNQWIVTDITPTCTDRVKMKFRLTETGTTQCLYCSRGTDYSTDTFTAFYINNVVRCDRNANTSTAGQTQPTTA